MAHYLQPYHICQKFYLVIFKCPKIINKTIQGTLNITLIIPCNNMNVVLIIMPSGIRSHIKIIITYKDKSELHQLSTQVITTTCLYVKLTWFKCSKQLINWFKLKPNNQHLYSIPKICKHKSIHNSKNTIENRGSQSYRVIEVAESYKFYIQKEN